MFECIKHHFHFKLELNGMKLHALGIGSDENISCADFYGLQECNDEKFVISTGGKCNV